MEICDIMNAKERFDFYRQIGGIQKKLESNQEKKYIWKISLYLFAISSRVLKVA